MGFFQICTGVVLLQMSKSAKDVPDAAVFKGDLDQVREIGQVEQPESEPKADAIRGTAALIRRLSVSRQKMEHEEARRLREDTMKDQLEPLRENEIVEWDGLRRRKTVIGEPGSPLPRRRTVHPPLGMSHFPAPDDDNEREPTPGFFENLRNRAQTVMHHHHHPPQDADSEGNFPDNSLQSPIYPVALNEIKIHSSSKADTPIIPYGPGSFEDAQERIYGLAPGERRAQDSRTASRKAQPSPRSKPLPARPAASPNPSNLKPPHEARRQFSFTNFLRPASRTPDVEQSGGQARTRSRTSSSGHEKKAMKNATEEERLGLVKGDSHLALLHREPSHSPTRAQFPSSPPPLPTHSHNDSLASVDEYYHYPHPAAQRSRSYSDEDDEWQMTSPPNEKRISFPRDPNPAPSTPTTRRRPSPPRTYPPPSSVMTSSSTNVGRLQTTAVPRILVGDEPTQARVIPAVSVHSPTSLTSPTLKAHERHDHGSHLDDGDAHPTLASASRGRAKPEHEGTGYVTVRMESPEEYENGRKRYEEQSKREREERRLRATGRRQSWKPATSP